MDDAVVTPAELVAWQRRMGLRTDAEAAELLRISAVSYRRKRTGELPITAQTELLCDLLELVLFELRVSDALDAQFRLARLAGRLYLADPSPRQAALIAELREVARTQR